MAVKTKEVPRVMYMLRDLAEEMGLPNKTLIATANELGIADVKSYASKLTAGQADRLRAKLGVTKKQKEELAQSKAKAEAELLAATTAKLEGHSRPVVEHTGPRFGVVVPAPGYSMPSPSAPAASSAPVAKALQLTSLPAPSNFRPGTVVRKPDAVLRSSSRHAPKPTPPSSESSWLPKAEAETVIKQQEPAPETPVEQASSTLETAPPAPAFTPHTRTHTRKTERDLEKERFEQNKKKNRKKSPEYKDEIKKRKEAATVSEPGDSDQPESAPAKEEKHSAHAARAETHEGKHKESESGGVLKRLIKRVFGS